MNDEQAFLDAIAAAPGDNTARLVYADWLDDHDAADRDREEQEKRDAEAKKDMEEGYW